MKITLCGSTKFKDDFIRVNEELSMLGHVVLSVGLFGHADNKHLAAHEKTKLDRVHKEKIDLSDAIFVINKGGYIGDSTRSEILHALKNNKRVVYMEPAKYDIAFMEVS